MINKHSIKKVLVGILVWFCFSAQSIATVKEVRLAAVPDASFVRQVDSELRQQKAKIKDDNASTLQSQQLDWRTLVGLIVKISVFFNWRLIYRGIKRVYIGGKGKS